MTFTESQLATLRALVDCIIPADDYPSGWDAGVGEYLARQFERDLRSHVEFYRAGLNALETEAEASTGASFVSLNSDAQDALLRRIEVGDTTTRWPIDPVTFFRDAVNHTIEGFYSDPANGGNRNAVAWHMIGFQVRK
jgi:hypothetical protein